MTGLSPPPLGTDTILSISCLLTTADLTVIEPQGFDAIIHHSQQQLDAMSEWCIATHGKTGLTGQCLASGTTAEEASTALLEYIKTYIPSKGVALLAGNSIHADRMFLIQAPWTKVLEHLHYRVLDVSSMKEMVRRWCGEEVLRGVPRKSSKHTAGEDVRESLEEGRFYMRLLKEVRFGGEG
jgi:oligoribonuclease (3'-5' exoribonuclease)